MRQVAADGIAPHDRHREPVVDDRCRTCGKVFNLYSGGGAARDRSGDRWCTPTIGGAYDDLNDRERRRFSVNHNRRECARDDDGDGVREVHSNRIEGFWLGLRNYLRPFRGVSKGNLDLYLAFYQGTHNFRRNVLGFFRQLLRPITPEGI